MNREILETMKVNTRGWMFLSPAEQECLHEVNKTGGAEILSTEGAWAGCKQWLSLGHRANDIWRIRPTYQQGPEYIDIEVVLDDASMWLRLQRNMPRKGNSCVMDCTINPKFVGFFILGRTLDVRISLDNVATAIRSGKEVFARFRKENKCE